MPTKQIHYLPLAPSGVHRAKKVAERCYDGESLAMFDEIKRAGSKVYGMQAVKDGRTIGVMVYQKSRWWIRLHILCTQVGQRNQQIGSTLLECLIMNRLNWHGQRFIYHRLPAKYEIGAEFLMARGFVVERVETGGPMHLHLRYQLQMEEGR